jgi:hypothetical protein
MGQDQDGKNAPKSSGITTVVSVGTNQIENKDELLDVLKNLPKAKPLLSKQVLQNPLNFFNDKKNLRGNTLRILKIRNVG